MAHLQARFNRFFDAILTDLREMLRRQSEPQTYSDEFGEDFIPHMRAHMTDPKERTK